MTRTMNTSAIQLTGSVPAISKTATVKKAVGLFARVGLILDVWQERRRLAGLDERSLRDLGLSKADVENEASRWLFDLPSNRR